MTLVPRRSVPYEGGMKRITLTLCAVAVASTISVADAAVTKRQGRCQSGVAKAAVKNFAGQVGRVRPNEAGREPRNVIQAT